jgi:hypothetical protein
MPEYREIASEHSLQERDHQSPSEGADLDNVRSPEIGRWIGRYAWPLTAMLTILVTGMAVSFWWNPLIHHGSSWYTPNDLWNTYRTSQYVGWGFEGEIYKSQTYFDSFPGIAVLLAPIAKVASTLHLSANFLYRLPRPTAWLILGPANAMLSGVLLFPLEGLARRLLVPYGRRVALVWLEAGLISVTAVVWGHPEYTLALTFAIYGLIATLDGRWVRVGVFMGLALLFQPLTALMLPVVIMYLPARRWFVTSAIVALPSLLLLIPPLVKEWHATTFTLLQQPNYPTVDHPTPWLSLAPVLQRSHWALAQIPKLVTRPDGTRVLEHVTGVVRVAEVVSAGPGRLVALVIACVIGICVAKTKPKLSMIVWWIAVALSLRCVFECVMNPYYLLPAGAVIIVLATTLNNLRFLAIVAFVAACSAVSYRFMNPWAYYTLVVGLLVVALATAYPRERSVSRLEPNLIS